MSKYEVNDKFIIEIAEVCTTDRRKSTEEGHTLYRVKGFNSLVFDDNGLDKLKKCEQPTISEDTLEMERMKALNDGRNEVWELVRRLYNTSLNEIKHIFGANDFKWDEREIIEVIIKQNTPQEALAKLEAYEKEQNEIKVGDIVYNDNTMEEGVVTHIDNGEVFMLYDDGSCGNTYGNLTKTGKHIDIQSVLKQIGSDADELS